MTPEQNKFLADAIKAAVDVERRSGCPAELIVAQAILETGWGKSLPGFNAFGIKARAGDMRQLLTTKEWFTSAQLTNFLNLGDGRTAVPTGKVNGMRKEFTVKDWFAAYPDLAACFDRRAELFRSGRYKPFATQFDKDRKLEALIRGIGPIYATAPDYADLLLKLIGQANVQKELTATRAVVAVPAARVASAAAAKPAVKASAAIKTKAVVKTKAVAKKKAVVAKTNAKAKAKAASRSSR